jgi:hypothetical protein
VKVGQVVFGDPEVGVGHGPLYVVRIYNLPA